MHVNSPPTFFKCAQMVPILELHIPGTSICTQADHIYIGHTSHTTTVVHTIHFPFSAGTFLTRFLVPITVQLTLPNISKT